VELFQRIEQLIGKKLPLYKTEEEEVMQLTERVNEAQKFAAMVNLFINKAFRFVMASVQSELPYTKTTMAVNLSKLFRNEDCCLEHEFRCGFRLT